MDDQEALQLGRYIDGWLRNNGGRIEVFREDNGLRLVHVNEQGKHDNIGWHPDH